LRLFSFGGYVLALVVFGAYDSYLKTQYEKFTARGLKFSKRNTLLRATIPRFTFKDAAIKDDCQNFSSGLLCTDW